MPRDRPEFVYGAPNRKVPGSLSHAGNSNERLAIAVVGKVKYIFAYTTLRRSDDINIDQLRDLMDTFLPRSFVARADTALDFDRGGSVFVS